MAKAQPICPNCRRINDVGAKECFACGTPLVSQPASGTSTEPSADEKLLEVLNTIRAEMGFQSKALASLRGMVQFFVILTILVIILQVLNWVLSLGI